jgi:hypothetical protein
MAHCAGGCALSGYCVPQAVQMKSDMDVSKLQAQDAARRRLPIL